MKNLIIRTITGILFVVVLVGGIVWNPYSLLLLFTVITALTVWEFTTIINHNMHLHVNRFITTVAAAYLFVAVWAFNTNIMGSEVFIPYLISIIYLLVSEIYFDRSDTIQNWAMALMAQLYIALPFASFNTLCFISTPTGVSYYFWYALSVFIFLWANDSGAYLIGSWLGKHRLFPRISPKKSWEGSIGGGIVAIIASQVLATFIPFAENLTPTLSRLLWAGLAVLTVIFGTWGDLVESLLKRKLGIKDSGNILPGHGGMLDRFDSSLLAIPAAVIYIYTIMLNIIQ
ncbi:MAG: phosphatidate cytidylyltransferase [Bacteroidaceae bacterium]|nr:phosphatidate cytidylyltransferase [Bacteroidaceae bacterium]MBR1521551.1 phosphatidate cytidylyltransferase [Bacteroidaceae bacterium]